MFRTYSDTVRTKVPDRVDKKTATKYYCEFCEIGSEDRAWDSEPDLEIHRRNVHKREIKMLLRKPNRSMCTVCLHSQNDKASLVKHIKTHHLLSPADSTFVKREIFICNYCDRIFFNKQLLTIHMSSLHLLSKKEKRNFKTTCPSCFNKLSMKSVWFHFVHHGIIHTPSCPVCLKTFDDSMELIKHVQSHPGYYNCSICGYETKKELLYHNHLQKHKKNIDCNDYKTNNVSKYFIPQSDVYDWSKKYVNIFRGLQLDPKIKVCILCRAICHSKDEMLNHIYGDHCPKNTAQTKVYLCVCGEEFSNNILLKHHVFKLKEDHRVFNGSREELDLLLEQSADWENCNSNSEPGALCIDVDMDLDSENNANNAVLNTDEFDPIINDKPSNGNTINDKAVNDWQNGSNEINNDNENCLNSINYNINMKSSNDNGKRIKAVDFETANHMGINDMTANDMTDNDMTDNDMTDNDMTVNDMTVNDTNDSSFETNYDREYYEEIIVVTEDENGIESEALEAIDVPEGTDQVVYKVLLTADSGEVVNNESNT